MEKAPPRNRGAFRFPDRLRKLSFAEGVYVRQLLTWRQSLPTEVVRTRTGAGLINCLLRSNA
jgi:hypothetical protein